MAPETCKVFERPIPSVAVEWQRIHEWYEPLESSLLLSEGNYAIALGIPAFQHLSSFMVHPLSRSIIVHSGTRSQHESLPRSSPPHEPS